MTTTTTTPVTDTIFALLDDGHLTGKQANAALAAIWQNGPDGEWHNARHAADLNYFATVDDDGHVAEWCEPCSKQYLVVNPGSNLAPINPRYDRCCDQCGAYRGAQS